jgi:predicted amidohydrolase
MLRVTVLELPATWGDPRPVLASVEQALAAGPATDLVLLPEQSLSGYVSRVGDFDLTPFAEPLGGPTHAAIAALARRANVTLVAPLVLREGPACYNATIAAGPAGELVFVYRKRHPWYPELWATPGPEPAPVVTIGGARVTVAVCFDLHFLEDDAASELDACDLLLFPSAWVAADDERGAALPALARRHRIAIANANWAPGEVRIAGQGSSSIVGPQGERLASVPPPRDARRHAIARADATLAVTRRE